MASDASSKTVRVDTLNRPVPAEPGIICVVVSFDEPVRGAVVPTAGSDGVSPSEGTSGGTPGEPAGADARATEMADQPTAIPPIMS
jgi:hypothetical protein